jgi:hypothetical protein
MTSTDPDTDPTTAAAAEAEFTFEAHVRWRGDDRVEAIVRYDGDDETLRTAAQQVGVDVDEADPDGDGNRRIRVSGDAYGVNNALREYAGRARRRRAYELGDLGVGAW